MNWNQPKCDTCWEIENPNREPCRLRAPYIDDPERCSSCGEPTVSGIYVRQHPNEVAFPAPDVAS